MLKLRPIRCTPERPATTELHPLLHIEVPSVLLMHLYDLENASLHDGVSVFAVTAVCLY